MTPDINLIAALLRGHQQSVSSDGMIKPPGTGDDMALPPDPGSYGNPPEYLLAAQKGQMPFPDNHNPSMDFANRWPNIPPSGVLNDLKPPVDNTPQLIRKLPNG